MRLLLRDITLILYIIITQPYHAVHATPIPINLFPSLSSLSNYENSVCKDGDLNKFIEYSGFKIQRHMVLKGMKPPLLHFVSLSNCELGELKYERLERTGRDTDIEWSKPMCFLGNKRITDDRGVVISRPERNKKSNKMNTSLFLFRNLTIEDAPTRPHAVDITNQRPPQVLEKRSIRDKFLSFLNSISKTRFLDYFNQDSNRVAYEDLKPISYTEIDSEDITDMHCYKMARRKKYALRDLMIYAPRTWVGGLFECNNSDEDKKKYLTGMKSSRLFAKPYEIQCNAENATPLYPLIADDITKLQYEYDKGSLAIIRTPYLYTPTNLDPRFGKPSEVLGLANAFLRNVINKDSTDKLPYDNWFEEIDINENYTYTAEDLKSITNAVTNATHLLKAQIGSGPSRWDWDDAGVFGETEKERPHYLELKTLFSLTKIKEQAKRLSFVKDLQQVWDDMRLSKESFKYRIPLSNLTIVRSN